MITQFVDQFVGEMMQPPVSPAGITVSISPYTLTNPVLQFLRETRQPPGVHASAEDVHFLSLLGAPSADMLRKLSLLDSVLCPRTNRAFQAAPTAASLQSCLRPYDCLATVQCPPLYHSCRHQICCWRAPCSLSIFSWLCILVASLLEADIALGIAAAMLMAFV